jgi:hypothetical protein
MGDEWRERGGGEGGMDRGSDGTGEIGSNGQIFMI